MVDGPAFTALSVASNGYVIFYVQNTTIIPGTSPGHEFKAHLKLMENSYFYAFRILLLADCKYAKHIAFRAFYKC